MQCLPQEKMKIGLGAIGLRYNFASAKHLECEAFGVRATCRRSGIARLVELIDAPEVKMLCALIRDC